MSLMSRVRDIDDVPTLAASADDHALERLKEHIQRFVSTDDIAAIMAEQPSRARNELKSACRQAFEDASWAGVSQREQQRLTDGLIDMVFGFGPLESLLADDSVTEIMVNGPSDVFFERDGRLHRSEQRFADEGQLRALIDEGLVDSVDLYKVGHHGSKNALDDEEAAVLSPRIALVSAGARNRYGHPAQDTLDRLEAAGARVFRTDEQGDVSCKLTADRIEVDTLR